MNSGMLQVQPNMKFLALFNPELPSCVRHCRESEELEDEVLFVLGKRGEPKTTKQMKKISDSDNAMKTMKQTDVNRQTRKMTQMFINRRMNTQMAVIYPYNGIAGNEILIHVTTWMNLKIITLGEKKHMQNTTCCMILFISF